MRGIVIAFLLLFSLSAQGQFIIDSYRFGAAGADLLLDSFPNADVAYSFRKLRTAYTGDCCVVRRASDNTLDTIGFLASNIIDTTALKTFCSSTNCFVNVWFDQSGNGRNNVQDTASRQPQIIASGNLVTEGSRVAISFDGTDFFRNTTPQVITHTIIAVALTTTQNQSVIAGTDSNVNFGTTFGYINSTDFRLQADNNSNVTAATVNFERLFFAFNNVTTAAIFSNSVSRISAAGFNTVYDYNVIGGRRSQNPLSFNGKMQEIIIYPSDQSTNRTAIETNINNFYSIY
jgi:hypothetical protein